MKNLIAAVLASAFALGAGAQTTAPSMAAAPTPMVQKDAMKSDTAKPMVKKSTKKHVKKHKTAKPAA